VHSTDDGKIVRIRHSKVKGYEDHFAVCGRPQTIFEARFVPERIRRPLIRVGERGEGRFREISWDEALSILAEKLKQYDPEEIIVFAHQGPDVGLFTSFMKSIVGVPNITKHCDTCHTALDVASWFVFGKLMGPGAYRPDYEHAELVVIMGRNPTEGIVATPWSKAFSEGREHGLRLIVFDVRETRLTALAYRYYIIPPGTDLAIVLAILHVLLRDRLYDEEYLRRYTNASMLIYADTLEPVGLTDHPEWKGKKTYLVLDEADGKVKWKTEAKKPALMWEGEYRGRPVKTVLALVWDSVRSYTPEWAEGITGVPAREIEWVARELARHAPRAFIDPGYKATRYFNEGMFNRVKMIVNALLGSIGVRGGIAWPYKPKPPSPFKVLGIKGRGAKGKPLYKYWEEQGIRFIHPKCYSQLALRSLLEGKPRRYRMVIIYNQNLVAHVQGSSRVIEALKRAEFVVVIDTTHNETTLWADLVLPLTMFFEQDGSTIATPSKVDIGQVGVVEKVVDPPPGIDARPGWWIVAELGKRLDPANADKYEALKNPRAIWAKQAEAMGIDPARLFEQGVVVVRGEPIYHPLKGKYHATVTGEIELINVKALQQLRDHIGKDSPLNPLPRWIPPRWMTRSLGENEFVAVDVCDKMTATNMWIRFSAISASSLRWRRFDGVLIHEERAKRLGISDGDLVRIIGPGGELVARARLTRTVHPVVAVGPHATNPGREVEVVVEGADGRTYRVRLFSYGGGRGVNTNMVASFDDLVAEEGARAMQCDVVVRIEPLGR
jgi:thiosulfate reductase/polysulfide reductase chain A